MSNDEDSGSLYDVLIDENDENPDYILIRESLKKEIDRSLKTLNERDANIIRYFYGLNVKHPLSMEEIGDLYDLRRERVRQIDEKALKKLQFTSRSKLLRMYLG